VFDEILHRTPQPDFETFASVLTGKQQAKKVHLVELGIDPELMRIIYEQHWQKAWKQDTQSLVLQKIEFYYRMGYDTLRFANAFVNLPQFLADRAQDTAPLSHGVRTWVKEDDGLIHNWDEFKAIPWDQIQVDRACFQLYAQNLPQGMKMMISYPFFEIVMQNWLGYQGLCLGLIQNPDLVAAVFEAWGNKVAEFYQTWIADPQVGGIFHSDDLGYKTATIISPKHLRKYVLPWFKKYADLAHQHGKVFFLHSCGNLGLVLPDLVQEIRIDALHSFQDQVMPVVEFKKRYPQVGALGGVDMDKLSRLAPEKLKEYLQQIVSECQRIGQFALGSGNSVTNYVPLENYLTMVQAAHDWSNL